jgi:hypothetical protein
LRGSEVFDTTKSLKGSSLANLLKAGAQWTKKGKFEGVPIQPMTGLDDSLDPKALNRYLSSETHVGISVIFEWNCETYS